MRKSLLVLATAGSVFAVTAAGATGINLTGGGTVNAKTSSAVSVTSSVCTDTFGLSYTLDESGAISAVVVDDTTTTPTDGCKGATVKVTLGDGDSYSVNETATLGASTGDANVTISYDLTTHSLVETALLITAS